MTPLTPKPAPLSVPSRPAWGLFALLQAIVVLFVFRAALWGGSLLAPLDIAASLMPHYQFVDPSIEAPNNHYIIDQMSYDLPLQRTIYQAYRRGEIPWWDPYTYAGRPLIGDAHINGTDPLRLLCYFTLPFPLAYNWTLILHFAFAGAGLWMLLRRLGMQETLAIGVALAWEFAGCHVIKIGHPWLLGSFAWYPWLWLALHQALETGGRGARLGAALSVAAVFYAGNVQSHAYLPLFFAAWTFGYGGLSRAAWAAALRTAAPAAVLGGLLAAPVLLNEVEFYRLNVRPIETSPEVVANPWIAPWLTLLGMVHPWLLGTFHTFDASKLGGHGLWALGFRLYAGSVALGGAALAWWPGERRLTPEAARPARAAALMIVAYFLVLGTPLVTLLYPRAAGLGCLGLAVLAAFGLDRLFRSERRWVVPGRAALLALCAITVGAHVLAWVVWPRVKPRLEARVQAEIGKAGLGPAPALRARQFGQFAAEVSFANPEGLLAAAGWLALAAALWKPEWRSRPGLLPALLALNLAPPLLFAARYIPRQDIALWNRLEAGGPDQRAVAEALNAEGARLWEPEPWMRFRLFPGALAHLHQIRTIGGYSALRPPNLAELPVTERDAYLAQFGDAIYTQTNAVGRLAFSPGSPSRFRWVQGGGEAPRFTQLGLNAFRLDFSQPRSGSMLWTDTWYPGWRVSADGAPAALERVPPCFTQVTVASPARVWEFRYRPYRLTPALVLAAAGAVGLAFWTAFRPHAPRREA